ncbi:MAG: gliding motility-associated C-terminal domain-containing protein [Bacteroidales bacterium]|nr:gliding motility-associated C-terminal domain-containing protein [Bacteroidales bacterium]
MRSVLTITIIFYLASGFCFAQKEGLNWYFGQNAGLRFHNGYPEPMSGALSTTEGCSTISNKYGNLMLYTDGVTVYDRQHLVMPNGTGLYGDPSSTQSGVIVPVPGDTNTYYIFTVSNLDKKGKGIGFCYSKVDMLLNEGWGAITDKNVLLFSSTTERITSVKHQNDYGVWVIGHEWESSNFRSYLVTSAGISTSNPVISNVGLYHGGALLEGKGYMKISPDGAKLAVAIQGMNLFEVFDFNNSTGVISDPFQIPMENQPYGVEFSRDAAYLYATERYSVQIYQWDLNAGSVEEIINSRTIIGELQEPNSLGGALQMASDGRIYMAIKQKTYLAAISEPSLPGLECEFVENAVNLNSGDFCQWGLPSFIQSYFNNLWIEFENECVGEEIYFSLNDTTNIENVKWDFGDPESGANNISFSFETSHIYSDTGTYEIKLVLYYLNTSDSLYKTIEVYSPPSVDLGDDLKICENDSVILNANGDYSTCKWMNDPTLILPDITIKEEGNYWVDVSNICGVDQDTVYVEIQPLPDIFLGNDTIIKQSTSITLNPGMGYTSYIWQDGSSSVDYITELPGTFWVEVTDDTGCKSSDTILIEPEYIQIHVPDAFSPNGDEVNDIFIPISSYEANLEYEMMIFNRYGEMVFLSKSINTGWDGNYHQQPCPMEVYIWVINAKTRTKNAFYSGPIILKGNVTLLR